MKKILFGILVSCMICIFNPAHSQTPMPNTDIYIVPLKITGEIYTLGKPENITKREGYDNQPAFLPDGSKLLYTAIKENPKGKKNADVYQYDFKTKQIKQITNTPEDEFSPTPTPDGKYFSVVRVEKDSTQRLWKFPLAGGTPEMVLPNVRRVGYHCWADNNVLGLWILGDSMKVGDTRLGMALFVDTGIGRCILKIPNDQAYSFVKKKSKDDWVIIRYGMGAGKKWELVKCLPGSEDYVWTPDGSTLLCGNDGKLYKFHPRKDKEWVQIADFKGTELANFYRIAISAQGDKLALVSYKGKKP